MITHIWKPLDKANFVEFFLHALFHTDEKSKEETNDHNVGG